MALRSPSKYHNFWGATFAAYANLPNVSGSSTQSTNLEVGDLAYVTGTSSLYVCTVATSGSAVWGQAQTTDRFAPKYIVGNTLNGDSAASYTAAGFRYIPDPGDGSGIETALTEALGTPGDVWIRPGTYDLSAGVVAVPMAVPANVRVEGAGVGVTTIKSKTSPSSQQVFQCSSGSSIFDMTIESNGTSTYSAVPSTALVKAIGGGVTIQNVTFVLATQDVTDGLRHAFLLDTAGGSSLPFCSLENVFVQADLATTPQTTPTTLIKVLEGQISARAITTFGGDIAFEAYNQSPEPTSGGAILFAQDILCINFAYSGAWFHQIPSPGNPQGGAMRLSTGLFVGSFGGTAQYGVQIQGGSLHVLRSNYFSTVATGVIVNPDVGVSASGQITSSLINAFGTGVEIGTGIGSVVGFGVSDCEITATDYGVRVEKLGPSTSGISITNNTITTSEPDNGSVPIYIQDAVNTVPSGNVINQTDAGYPSTSIWVANSQHCTCVDNLIVSDGAFGIRIDSGSNYATVSGNDVTMTGASVAGACYLIEPSRTVVQGNIAHVDTGGSSACVGIDMPSTASLTTVVANTVEVELGIGISIAGTKNTCNGNTMGVDTSPTAAISVSGNQNVVIGNFCGTTPPVNNTGAGNEIAHNI